jgi:hypothetical protein
MDSCPDLAIFTFLSLLFNAAFVIHWYTKRERNTSMPDAQYQTQVERRTARHLSYF